jgi:uncharacterized membrane protein YeiH
MQEELDPVTIPLWFDLLAVFIGGLSGSLAAMKKHFDVGGLLIIVLVSALGGGLIRDVLIGRGTPAALVKDDYLYTALAAAAIGFLFSRLVRRIRPYFLLIDAAALGAFMLVGMDKGLRADLPVITAMLLGVITAVGGGLLRDILSGEVPAVLRPGHFTLTAAAVGAVEFALFDWADAPRFVSFWVVMGTVMLIHLASMWFGWVTPEAEEIPSKVTAVGSSLVLGPRRLLPNSHHRGDASGGPSTEGAKGSSDPG